MKVSICVFLHEFQTVWDVKHFWTYVWYEKSATGIINTLHEKGSKICFQTHLFFSYFKQKLRVSLVIYLSQVGIVSDKAIIVCDN